MPEQIKIASSLRIYDPALLAKTNKTIHLKLISRSIFLNTLDTDTELNSALQISFYLP